MQDAINAYDSERNLRHLAANTPDVTLSRLEGKYQLSARPWLHNLQKA